MRALPKHYGRRGHYVLLTLSISAMLLSSTTAFGQEPSRFGDYDAVSTSYHKFVLPGEVSINVLVLGSVGQAGLYEVGRETDLGRLVALTGASLGEARSNEKRRVTLRLFRDGSNRRDIVYEASFEDFLSLPDAYPRLADGDVLVIESTVKARFGWRDALSIVTGAAALTLAIERVTRAVN